MDKEIVVERKVEVLREKLKSWKKKLKCFRKKDSTVIKLKEIENWLRELKKVE